MTGIGTLIWESITCPFTTVALLLSCWTWTQFFVEEWDPRHFSSSYNDVVKKRQWWRVLSAPISYNSVWHLLINATFIWNLRLTEINMGTLFIFRYSIVLAICEALLSMLLIHVVVKYTPMGPYLEPVIANSNSFGSSGVITGWVTYQSFASMRYQIKRHFVLFGFIALPQAVSTLVVAIVFYFCLPREAIISNLTGLVSGFLLTIGVLQFLPDFFWSFCFLLNVALIVLSSIQTGPAAVLPRSVEDEGRGDLLEVLDYRQGGGGGHEDNSSSSSSSSSASRQGSGGRQRGHDRDIESGLRDGGEDGGDDDDEDDDDDGSRETAPLLSWNQNRSTATATNINSSSSSSSSNHRLARGGSSSASLNNRSHHHGSSSSNNILDYDESAV